MNRYAILAAALALVGCPQPADDFTPSDAGGIVPDGCSGLDAGPIDPDGAVADAGLSPDADVMLPDGGKTTDGGPTDDASTPLDAARPPIECGGLIEGAACNEAEWHGLQCFNGNCWFDCASGCTCVSGIWKCFLKGCRTSGRAPDGGVLACGTSPRCWSMCGAPP